LANLPKDGLVLYKGRPARVKEPGADRLVIELVDGSTQKVRPKDVALLHKGPCDPARLAAIGDVSTEDADAVRQLLATEGEAVDLQDLAGLIHADPPTSEHVWRSWRLLDEGVLFEGSIETIQARTDEQVAESNRQAHEAAAQSEAWAQFVERLRCGECEAEDADHLREVERMAEETTSRSRVLRALGRSESPEAAHALLLDIGWWDERRIPHLKRHDLPTQSPEFDVGTLPDEPRTDLTHLPAFAIDDEGNTDPDDAVSIDADGALWVHVADVAALAPIDSALDMEARGRGATLYLPTGPVTMLPPAVVEQLGLGLKDPSPALSFRLEIDEDGLISDVSVMPSWVRVERLSYQDADPRLQTPPLAGIHQITQRAHERRLRAGALDLKWPEARIRVDEHDQEDAPVIDIQPLTWLQSRDMVAEAMILAGEGAARFAAEREIPFPFSSQPTPDPEAVAMAATQPDGPASDFSRRRCQRPGRVSGTPDPHAGLGVEMYARATSPLRRYLDLVAHQQLRGALGRGQTMDPATVVERVGAAEAVAGGVRGGEADARRHWTLVYLQQRPEWEGTAVVVDVRGRRGLLLLPDLALETSVSVSGSMRPGDTFTARLQSVDLARQNLSLQLHPVPLEDHSGRSSGAPASSQF